VYAKFRCAPLHIKKALGIFRELAPRTRRRTTTTRVAFGDPPSGSKKLTIQPVPLERYVIGLCERRHMAQTNCPSMTTMTTTNTIVFTNYVPWKYFSRYSALILTL